MTDNNNGAEGHKKTKEYYIRKIFSSIPYYIGMSVLALALVLFITGYSDGAFNILFPGLICAFFGGANRKPRVILEESCVKVRPGLNKIMKTIHLDQLASVGELKGTIVFKSKDGSDVQIPKRELTKKERANMIKEINDVIQK